MNDYNIEDNLVQTLTRAVDEGIRIGREVGYKKALEELQPYIDLYKDLTEKAEKVAREAIDKYPKWTSVTERLPSEGTSVLVYEFGRVEQAYTTTYTADKSLCWVVNGGNYHRISDTRCPIKWWMPLPEPPKENES